MPFTFVPDGAVLDRLLHSQDGAVGRYMETRSRIFQLACIQDCPKRTNLLSESINRRWFEDVELTVIVAAQQPYALWVHNGTGIYGPHKTPIVPLGNSWFNVLHWIGPGGEDIFAKSVKGQKPQPFMARNLPLVWAS